MKGDPLQRPSMLRTLTKLEDIQASTQEGTMIKAFTKFFSSFNENKISHNLSVEIVSKMVKKTLTAV